MDRGAQQAIVNGFTRRWIWLSDWTTLIKYKMLSFFYGLALDFFFFFFSTYFALAVMQGSLMVKWRSLQAPRAHSMTQRTQPTSCRASFLRVVGLRHHVTARDENGNLPFPYTWCPNPQWESDAYGTAISVSGHSWFLDGRWTRGSPSASYLLMHCGTASWGREGSITLY